MKSTFYLAGARRNSSWKFLLLTTLNPILIPIFSFIFIYQLWPHSNFGDEIKYISSHDKLQDRLKGSGYILGPITGDHWFVYVADHSETSSNYSSLLNRTSPSVLQPIVETAPSTGKTSSHSYSDYLTPLLVHLHPLLAKRISTIFCVDQSLPFSLQIVFVLI